MDYHSLPLSNYKLFQTKSREVINSAVQESFRGVDFIYKEKESDETVYNHVNLESIGLHIAHIGGDMEFRAHALDGIILLHIPVVNRVEFIAGRDRIVSTRMRSACFLNLDVESTARYPRGARFIQVSFSRARLEAEATRLFGQPRRTALAFEPLVELRSVHGRRISRVVSSMVEIIDADPEMTVQTAVMQRYVDLMHAVVLLNQPNTYSRVMSSEPHPADRKLVRLVEDYLEANATGNIRLSDVARLTGKSLRAIQLAFKLCRDYTPSEFLCRTRLGLARKRLLKAAPNETVTDIAYACGFGHLGRFSHVYKAAYGELPSVTIRK